MKPELLAVRAINQYKHRDIIAYLGLRYYLQNDCSKQDIWIKDVATYLVNTRQSPVYFQSKHFKEIKQDSSNGDNIIYRNIYLPGPNEMLAESYLLHACSNIENFQSTDCVYSYRFPQSSSKEGIFKSYFQDFQKRNEFIHRACTARSISETKILFTDIKKFYPNISSQLATEAWRKICDLGKAPKDLRKLGDCLLQHYKKIACINNQECLGLLTGPMFSHLIANIVLTEIDTFMASQMGDRYCRYVDDFVLIGTSEEVKCGRNLLREKLDKLGLKLHDEEKDFEVSSSEWMKCNEIFSSINHNLWNHLVADLKRFLLVNPGLKKELEVAFLSHDISIPLLSYSSAIQESSYLERFSDWLQRNPWGLKSIRSLSIRDLVASALKVREIYEREIYILFNNDPNGNPYHRKQLISRVRFFAKRLAYLSNAETLNSLSSDLNKFPELSLQAKIMQAICSKDISDLIRFGSNAAQSVAEVMDAQGSQVTCSVQTLDDVGLQSLAIFNFYEVKINFTNNLQDAIDQDPLCQFSLYKNTQKLMKSDNLFVQELACLRGMDNPVSHKSILNSAFDRDEELCFSIIDKCQGSGYY